ncbi:MAG TPA: TIGR03809 family protein [Xanthobacteraceae bacterium]|nr:TIGR03809 family protein [Xanthobacteraceae bacterium]
MQARPTAQSDSELARKWSELVKRRRDYFVELHQTGRWKRYYTEAEFLDQLRAAVRAVEDWERLAARSQADDAG